MAIVNIKVSHQHFDVSTELKQLHRGNPEVGAACSFVGYVRDFGDVEGIQGMDLEHYPGMTEKTLKEIAEEAVARWSLQGVTIIHRVGYLHLSEQIVLVVCLGAHRKAAFESCEFIMDFLKVKAPFWKKERTREGYSWVKAKSLDEQSAMNWRSSGDI